MAPNSFIIKNKDSLSLIITETPKATKVVWIMQPDIKPKTVANPNFLPFTILCVSTKMLSGPGEQAKIDVAIINESKVSIIIKNK